MRTTITIPAAGSRLTINATGRSVAIEEMNVYPTAADVPILKMRPGSEYPLYPRSTYPNEDGIFNSLEIVGTAESAGDEITLLSTDECLPLELNIDFSASYLAVAGTTTTETLSDAVFSWDEITIQDANGNMPKSVLVQSLDEPIKLAFNVDPDQADPGNAHILNAPDGTFNNENTFEIKGIDFILAARFINATAATDSTLAYTFRY